MKIKDAFKQTVILVSSDPPFKVSIACFTTVPLKALPDKVCKLSMIIILFILEKNSEVKSQDLVE